MVKKYIFLCLPLFVPLIRGSLDYARDDGTFLSRHFDQVKRVEKSPNAKKGYATKSACVGEVCVASEVFLRKVKFVYDK